MPDYSSVEQTPPRAPIADDAKYVDFLGTDDVWPIPFTTMLNEETGESIFFQQDRFGIIWNFDPDLDGAQSYPGFEKLSAELIERFAFFCDVIEARSATKISPIAAECWYANEIPEVGIDQFAYGVLTNWEGDFAPMPGLRAGTSFSRHYHYEENVERPIWVSAASLTGDTGMTLSITARCVDESGMDAVTGLQTAHDILIDTFAKWTSSEMRKGWGPL
ncbi:hypothetical protein UB45_05845 [Terrabacter sp. 28]|nr:hypothetical protein UB45_05845 [Terrabacter sp. 28]